jgi:hypothetical protein
MDQTGVHLAPVDSRTYEAKGVKEHGERLQREYKQFRDVIKQAGLKPNQLTDAPVDVHAALGILRRRTARHDSEGVYRLRSGGALLGSDFECRCGYGCGLSVGLQARGDVDHARCLGDGGRCRLKLALVVEAHEYAACHPQQLRGRHIAECPREVRQQPTLKGATVVALQSDLVIVD